MFITYFLEKETSYITLFHLLESAWNYLLISINTGIAPKSITDPTLKAVQKLYFQNIYCLCVVECLWQV